MKGKKRFEMELNELRNKMGRQHASVWDKVLYGVAILAVIGLAMFGVGVLSVVFALPSLAMAPALALVYLFMVNLGIGIGSIIVTYKLLKKGMNMAINRVVERKFKDEFNIRAIRKLSKELQKEIACLVGARDSGEYLIVNDSIDNLVWLKGEIDAKYKELEKTPDGLGNLIRKVERVVNDAVGAEKEVSMNSIKELVNFIDRNYGIPYGIKEERDANDNIKPLEKGEKSEEKEGNKTKANNIPRESYSDVRAKDGMKRDINNND